MHDNDWVIPGLELTLHCRYQEAVAACKKGLLTDPDNEVAWLTKGKILRDLNQYEGAIGWYDRALGIDPSIKGAESKSSIPSASPKKAQLTNL